MDTRRSFIKKATALSGGAGLLHVLPPAIAKALAIDPVPGSTYLDAEHIVFLMQENRSFDHTYGTLQGVRGFNDPRAITLPDKNRVWLQTNKEGETYCPFRLDIKDTKATWMSSLPHSWSNQVDARNNGKYDKWLDAKHSGNEDYAAMPLTLGYYTREDIPFYYSLADAFTVCDQHFCSSLTGTTPNRLYFWTGTIRERPDENAQAKVWNEDADHGTMEENGISWKVYQNELYLDVGFEGEQEGWLSNFGDNPLEYFTQYQVKLSAEYIANLPNKITKLTAEIQKQEQQLSSLAAGSKEAEKIKMDIDWLRKYLASVKKDREVYTREKYERLPQREKNLHDKAFATNRGDPFYHQLDSLRYKDGPAEREVKLPKGDVLHQFRQDVKNGNLPAVSWVVAPENFSDHPSSAWYGAWYISEVMDILTQNPDVWKKTIFILTYDENDGYFDHVPPFVAPHPHKKETGFTSQGIKTGVDYVANDAQQSIKEYARESTIGLGYRVPLVIASPWSRGGWVNSEVFDHTSSLQFLEKFLTRKAGKKIEEPNISEWRRTVCGDLTSVFRPYSGEKIKLPVFVERDRFVESIHKAQFKNVPSNYKKLSPAEIALVNKHPQASPWMPVQEKGTRSSCALPYELYVDGHLHPGKKTVELSFRAGNQVFGELAAGSPFHVYAPGRYRQEAVRAWAYAVAAGDTLTDRWLISDFENSRYHLRVYGPNGFFREFIGTESDPPVRVTCGYEYDKAGSRQLTGNIVLTFSNTGSEPVSLEITGHAYQTGARILTLAAIHSPGAKASVVVNTGKNHGWYDFSVKVKNGHPVFEKRYAGRVETGKHGKTDPVMGA
jgi:phospholipase C